MLCSAKKRISRALQWISPHLHYWIVSLYQPVKARLFLRKYPRIITTSPHILLVAGEDCPDKLGPYYSVYAAFKTLREHFSVDLAVHASFRTSHVKRIAKMKPDLVLLGSDSGKWHRQFEQRGVPLLGSPSHVCELCFDKAAAKGAVHDLGIATTRWVVSERGTPKGKVVGQLTFPLVMKPLRGGRSRGVNKVSSTKELRRAIRKALAWDTQVIAEEYAPGREYACTVFGNETPQTLPLNRKIMPFEKEEMEARGEKVLKSRFPVLRDEPFVAEIHARSKRIYREFGCRDMVRIDWKYDPATQALWFLEINALPWIGRAGGNIEECAIAAGSSYEEFLVQLFRDSLRRHQAQTGA